MKLKTTKETAFEQGIILENKDIELVGCNKLCECDKVIGDFVKYNSICSKKNSFLNVFGLNSKFYYLVEHYRGDTVKSYEVGIGYLEKQGKKTLLKRFRPLYFSLDGSAPAPCVGPPTYFYVNQGEFLVVSNYTPRTYIELLPDPNCIISSVGPYVPQTVYVDENSVVGRFDENVQSIPISLLLNKIIKYEGDKVKFFNGMRWITLAEEVDEDTK